MTGDYPNVLVLGCTAARVSFHAQQTRAFNLVEVLTTSEPNLSAMKICVIGGGVAGVSAASYAQLLGYDVTLIEQHSRVLTLQAGSTRWVHPNIYDWPEVGWQADKTDLPTMNWRAGTASDVMGQLRVQWEEQERKCLLRRRVTTLTRNDNRWDIGCADGTVALTCDIVILAVGYGEELGFPVLRSPTYWTESDVHQRLRGGGDVLVSGAGDGGLIDVIRFCFNDFDHASLIHLGEILETPAMRDKVLEVEHDHGRYGSALGLSKAYEVLPVSDAALAHLKRACRTDVRVLLNSRGAAPLTRSSAILHRVLVALLMRLGRVDFVRGPLDPANIEVRSDGRYVVNVDGVGSVVDAVVLRHGPRSALAASFPRIAELVEPARDWHMRHRVASDDRIRLWVKRPASRSSSMTTSGGPMAAAAASHGAATPGIASLMPTGANTGDGAALSAGQRRALIAFGRELEATTRAHCTGLARSTVHTTVSSASVEVVVRLEADERGGLAEPLELVIDAVVDDGAFAIVLRRQGTLYKQRTLKRMTTLDAPALTRALTDLIADRDDPV